MAKAIQIRKEKPTIVLVEQTALAERMDPGYWDPKYEEVIERAAQGPFGSSLAPVRSLVDQTNISQGPKSKSEYVPKGLPYVRIGNIKPTGIDLAEEIKFVAENGAMDKAESRPKAGYVFVVHSGATIGKVAIWLDEFRQAVVSSVIFRLNFTKVNPYFASAYLKTEYGQSQLDRLKNGPAVENLNLDEVLSIQMVVPPEEIQARVEADFRDMSKHHLSAMKAAAENRCIDRDNELKIARLKLDDLLGRLTSLIAGKREKL